MLWSTGFDTNFVISLVVFLFGWYMVLILTQHDKVEFIGWGAWLVGLVCTILLDDFSTSVFEYLIGTGIWVLICLLLHWLALRNAGNDEMSDKTDYRT